MICTRIHSRSRRPGFTLMEMLVVIFGVSICMALGSALVLTLFRANQAGEIASNRVSQRAALATQFRADVNAADAAPEKFDSFTANSDCLILTQPGGTHIVYRWTNNQLERIEKTGDQETRRPVPVASPNAGSVAVEFLRPKAGAGVVTLRITEQPPRKVSGEPRRAEIVAALKGDLR